MSELNDLLLRVATLKRGEFFRRWNQSLRDPEMAGRAHSERLRFCLEVFESLDRVSLPPDIRFVSMVDADYPAAFWQLTHPPLGVFVSGVMAKAATLSIIGSRKPLPYSLRMATRFSGYWAERGMTIVSGGALGIDAQAHQACLDVGGKTIAILGGGLRRWHPKSHESLFRRILQQGGALMSEYPPLFEPKPYTFPERNRLIAALGDAVFLVQAHEKSGSLSTARAALDLGREIFVLRPPPHDASYLGAQNLIDAGAKLVTGPEDLSFDLRGTSLWGAPPLPTNPVQTDPHY